MPDWLTFMIQHRCYHLSLLLGLLPVSRLVAAPPDAALEQHEIGSLVLYDRPGTVLSGGQYRVGDTCDPVAVQETGIGFALFNDDVKKSKHLTISVSP